MVKLLIADPDPDTREHLRHLFAAGGIGVEVTGNGEEALRVAVDQDIDIVIAELDLPGMDGLTLLKECQRHCPETVCCPNTAAGVRPKSMPT